MAVVSQATIDPTPRLLHSRGSLALQTGERRAQVSLDRTIKKMDDPPKPHSAPATLARSRCPDSYSARLSWTQHLVFLLQN